MPRPKWGRKDVFEDTEAVPEDALPQRDVAPGTVPYIPTSALNRVYETGAAGFPDIDFVSPEEKRIEELEGQLAEIQQQLEGRTNAMSVQDGTLIVHDFQLTSKGLVAPDQVSFESWEQIGHLLFRLEGSIQWLIGDWLVYGANLKYGDIADIAKALGREPRTLHDYAYVSRSVEFSIRIENLSFGHHQLVAGMPSDEDQKAALGHAARQGLSVADFRKWLRQSDNRSVKRLTDYQATPEEQRPQVYEQYRREIEQFLLDRGALASLSRLERREVIHRAKWLQDSYADLIKAAKEISDA